MTTISRKKTRIHVSKNRKKSWRKHCDITDVEDFLENTRLEERTGGLICEKLDEELFTIDILKSPGNLKKKSKRVGTLKCHQNLTAYSQVPPPVNPQKRPLGKRKKELLAKEEQKKLENILSASQKTNKEKSLPQFRDLWAEEKKTIEYPYIEDLIEYGKSITKKKPVKIPDHRYQKPSLLPAVEVPHPGASYNPLYNEHQDLLSKAVGIEEKKLRHELHLKRVLDDMFPSKKDMPTEESYLNEMSQGLFDDDDPNEVPTVTSTLFANPRISAEDRKSKSKKRKERLLKLQLRNKASEKLANRKMSDIYRLRRIKAEIKQRDIRTAERMAEKQNREIAKMYRPRTLSHHKFEPSELEVNLTEELPESMRVLKAEGNLFEDRYKSLQKRNIIEPRVRLSRKRKYKLKVQIKRSHRNFQ